MRVVHRRLTQHAAARPVVLAAAAIAIATGVAATMILAVTTTGARDAQLPGWMSASYQPLSWVSAAALLLLLLVFSVHRRVTGLTVLAEPVFCITAPNLGPTPWSGTTPPTPASPTPHPRTTPWSA